MAKPSIESFVRSEDPLACDILPVLADYREEDIRLDYKETFHVGEEREWLEITKDVMAFANTVGGYLLFGVRDQTYDIVGLDAGTRAALVDVNTFQQKLNRFVEPPLLQLRSREFTHHDQTLVAMFIPRVPGLTHVISKDGKFKYPSGDDKQLLYKGNIYVRRSGGNHLADSRDIDELVGRRLDEFKNTLLERIARVVEAPPQSEVFVLSSDPTDRTGKTFIIDDGPNAVAVKGMSFTVAPKTLEQEVASWTVLLQRTPDHLPPPTTLWRWYAQRETMRMGAPYKLAVARFCLLSDVPVFYWLRGTASPDVRQMLTDAFTRRPPGRSEHILQVAMFLGKKFYESLARRIRDRRVLSHNAREYPPSGPRAVFGREPLLQIRRATCKDSDEGLAAYALGELNVIAGRVDGQTVQEPSGEDKWLARIYDCHLYAQDDKYAKSQEDEESPAQSDTVTGA